MALRREIDDVAGLKLTSGKDKHAPRLNFFLLAGGCVGLEIRRERIFELKRNPPPHDAHTVDSVN
jgi:hypothetical protein